MASTYQPPAPPMGGRPRGSSDPFRYVPNNYFNYPFQPNTNGYPTTPQAGAPFPQAYSPHNMNAPQYGQMVPYPGQPPYPVNNQLSPYDTRYHNYEGRRPSYNPDGRRNSQSSVRSHRSDRTRRSHSERPYDNPRRRSHSDVVDRDRRDHHHHHHDHRDDYNYERHGRRYSDRYSGRDDHHEHRHHHHHHHHHSDKYDDDDDDSSFGKPLKKIDTHRPTLGDTVVSMISYVKDSLGPRDKY